MDALIQAHPGRADEIRQHHAAPQAFHVRVSRTAGLRFSEHVAAAPSHHYRLPDTAYVPGAPPSMAEAARAAGVRPVAERTRMPANLQQEILAQPEHYRGAEALEAGQSLRQAGRDRTHHLADSASRHLDQGLYDRRASWSQSPGHIRRVQQFMAARHGGDSAAGSAATADLLAMGAPTQLPAFTTAHSNTPQNVGFGDSALNQNVVGPHFDASYTPSGLPTARTLHISHGVELLRPILPGSLIDAALAQPVDRATGEIQHSMTVVPHGYTGPIAPPRTLTYADDQAIRNGGGGAAPPAAAAAAAAAAPAQPPRVIAGHTLSREQRHAALQRVALHQPWASDLLEAGNWDEQAAQLSFTVHADGRVEADFPSH